MKSETIAAISTAQGEGGIGVIRISGEDALEVADKIFKNVNGKHITDMKGYTAAFGKVVCDGEAIDEAGGACFQSAAQLYGRKRCGAFVPRRYLYYKTCAQSRFVGRRVACSGGRIY